MVVPAQEAKEWPAPARVAAQWRGRAVVAWAGAPAVPVAAARARAARTVAPCRAAGAGKPARSRTGPSTSHSAVRRESTFCACPTTTTTTTPIGWSSPSPSPGHRPVGCDQELLHDGDPGHARPPFSPRPTPRMEPDPGASRTCDLTDAILAQLEGDLCIDKTRIFATGFSFGGAMSIALACTRADVFRAVAFFSGADLTGSCPATLTKPIAYWASQASQDSTGTPSPTSGRAKQSGVRRRQRLHGRPQCHQLPGRRPAAHVHELQELLRGTPDRSTASSTVLTDGSRRIQGNRRAGCPRSLEVHHAVLSRYT